MTMTTALNTQIPVRSCATIPEPLRRLCDTHPGGHAMVISIVGAGGKTSCLFWLAQAFSQLGKKVMITTTTHMFLPREGFPVILACHPVRLPDAVTNRGSFACYTGWNPQSNKVRGFSSADINALAEQNAVDVILAEADGARGFGIKAPAEHEPCIPDYSDCVIAVTDGRLLGAPVGPDNVHRWSHFSAVTGLNSGDTLDLGAISRLIRHPQGMWKSAPPGALRIWLINRFSQNENFSPDILADWIRGTPLNAVWFGAVREDPAITHILQRQ
ncbi:putative selenium-dependent hydroxylase accessory protein YqeC [Morganella morganii]|nr:putative selenium-dependent hydroxylase accessory protein YqeC [Morganella morganii]ELA7736219.1 putative selenium-dependent hydroxylase accessory protein YqeC [Morganella morganii]